MKSIHTFLILALLPLCSAFGAASPGARSSGEGETRPNVLLIVGDDIGFGDLGFMGSATHTPTLDELAH